MKRILVLLPLLLASPAVASTTEREAVDELATSIVSEQAMEGLAAVIADPDASVACRAYADVLLLYAAYVGHMLAFPESRVALSEFTGRVAASLPGAQYACENAV